MVAWEFFNFLDEFFGGDFFPAFEIPGEFAVAPDTAQMAALESEEN